MTGTPSEEEEGILYSNSMVSSRYRFTFSLLLLFCVHFVLMITKGLPEIQASHLDIDNTMSCEEKTLFYWVSLNESPFPEVSHQALPCILVSKSITGREAELSTLIHASHNSLLGLGPAALKHRPHIGRGISEPNWISIKNNGWMLDRQLIISVPPGFHQCQRVMRTRQSYRKVDEVRAPHWETRSRNQLFEV